MTFKHANAQGVVSKRIAPPVSQLARGLQLYHAYISNGISPPAPQARRMARQRLSRDRVSHSLSESQAQNIIDAAHFAATMAKPLNRFTTIHWQQAGVTTNIQGATLRFLKLAADWLRLRGETLAYIWVRESGDGKGEHVHILLHVPPYLGRAFSSRQRGWLKACGASFSKGMIFSRPVGRSLSHAFVGIRYGEPYQDHLDAALNYVLKSTSPHAHARLGLPKHEPSGVIIGKRCSTSQNIGRAARLPRVVP